MGRLTYEKNLPLWNAVLHCMEKTMPYKEAKEYSLTKGVRLRNSKQYQRVKKAIKDKIKEKFKNLESSGYALLVLNALKILNELKDDQLKRAKEAKDPWENNSAVRLVLEILEKITKFLDMAPVVRKQLDQDSDEK